MGMPQAARVWTREEVLALPDDGKRYELIDGELLVSPSPTWPHQWAVGGMFERLVPYVRANRIGVVTFSPADLDLNSGQFVQPDLFVTAHKPDGSIPMEWRDSGIPILVVEVASPSTARYDRITKRRRYQRSEVPEYWIVDIDARSVERWRPNDDRPEVLDEAISWLPVGATEPLVIDIQEYFREVWREREAPNADRSNTSSDQGHT